MTRDETFLQFQWRDKYGLVWTVAFSESPIGFSGFVRSKQVRGKGLIYVRTDDLDAEEQDPMAFVNDVRVDRSIEDRGLGSLLVREAIEECKRRGHKGMYGYLSDVDIGHFPKLEYFYRKLGFSVSFNDMTRPDYRYNRAGTIEMVFDDVRTES